MNSERKFLFLKKQMLPGCRVCEFEVNLILFLRVFIDGFSLQIEILLILICSFQPGPPKQ